jgi:2,4-dienoyl-CoA reductase-like NADH-dependent reductase (Old Yellow Enzyme family)
MLQPSFSNADPRITLLEQHRLALLDEVAAALERGYPASTIGRALVRDPAFVKKLYEGHTFRISTLIQARANIRQFDRPRFPVVSNSPSKVLD